MLLKIRFVLLSLLCPVYNLYILCRSQLSRRYDNSGLTPLQLAASMGDLDIASLLLQLGARVGRLLLFYRVDNDNRFASFFAKKWLQTIIVFREKTMRLS